MLASGSFRGGVGVKTDKKNRGFKFKFSRKKPGSRMSAVATLMADTVAAQGSNVDHADDEGDVETISSEDLQQRKVPKGRAGSTRPGQPRNIYCHLCGQPADLKTFRTGHLATCRRMWRADENSCVKALISMGKLAHDAKGRNFPPEPMLPLIDGDEMRAPEEGINDEDLYYINELARHIWKTHSQYQCPQCFRGFNHERFLKHVKGCHPPSLLDPAPNGVHFGRKIHSFQSVEEVVTKSLKVPHRVNDARVSKPDNSNAALLGLDGLPMYLNRENVEKWRGVPSLASGAGARSSSSARSSPHRQRQEEEEEEGCHSNSSKQQQQQQQQQQSGSKSTSGARRGNVSGGSRVGDGGVSFSSSDEHLFPGSAMYGIGEGFAVGNNAGPSGKGSDGPSSKGKGGGGGRSVSGRGLSSIEERRGGGGSMEKLGKTSKREKQAAAKEVGGKDVGLSKLALELGKFGGWRDSESDDADDDDAGTGSGDGDDAEEEGNQGEGENVGAIMSAVEAIREKRREAEEAAALEALEANVQAKASMPAWRPTGNAKPPVLARPWGAAGGGGGGGSNYSNSHHRRSFAESKKSRCLQDGQGGKHQRPQTSRQHLSDTANATTTTDAGANTAKSRAEARGARQRPWRIVNSNGGGDQNQSSSSSSSDAVADGATNELRRSLEEGSLGIESALRVLNEQMAKLKQQQQQQQPLAPQRVRGSSSTDQSYGLQQKQRPKQHSFRTPNNRLQSSNNDDDDCFALSSSRSPSFAPMPPPPPPKTKTATPPAPSSYNRRSGKTSAPPPPQPSTSLATLQQEAADAWAFAHDTHEQGKQRQQSGRSAGTGGKGGGAHENSVDDEVPTKVFSTNQPGNNRSSVDSHWRAFVDSALPNKQPPPPPPPPPLPASSPKNRRSAAALRPEVRRSAALLQTEHNAVFSSSIDFGSGWDD